MMVGSNKMKQFHFGSSRAKKQHVMEITNPFGQFLIEGQGIVLLFIVFFIVVEWLGREEEFALNKFGLNWPKPIRHGFYMLLITSIFLFSTKEQQFIYFQF